MSLRSIIKVAIWSGPDQALRISELAKVSGWRNKMLVAFHKNGSIKNRIRNWIMLTLIRVHSSVWLEQRPVQLARRVSASSLREHWFHHRFPAKMWRRKHSIKWILTRSMKNLPTINIWCMSRAKRMKAWFSWANCHFKIGPSHALTIWIPGIYAHVHLGLLKPRRKVIAAGHSAIWELRAALAHSGQTSMNITHLSDISRLKMAI